ncbi:hypothetical protein [Nocardia noduli]|uniref:hypothetical protein n=1 Tax=Nocardia noduli TaxID=2815722 RepID=UPI001C24078C|nr:hypothetical protein [Nocardia noduli]
MSPIQHEFTTLETESLICTAAELWASTGDPTTSSARTRRHCWPAHTNCSPPRTPTTTNAPPSLR